jgi:hypothetical protein
MHRLAFRRPFWILTLLALAVTVVGLRALPSWASDGDVVFSDVKAQSAQFIEYYNQIKLTPEQEAIKKEALTALPAPCCSDNTAYTCCCPCNMSLTIWGLSAHLIVNQGYQADALREKVKEWVAFINPDGYSGNVCYTGGCARPFKHNGCGGMRPGHVTYAD